MGFVTDTIGSITGANAYGEGAQKAAGIQADFAEQGIGAIDDQLQNIMNLMQPYTSQGADAFGAQGNLIGLGGNDAQAQAIAALQASPQFTEQLRLGNENMLQNASATGGLRGGNTQAAMAQFSPQLLNQLIDQQYSQLGGLSQQGLSAAGTSANAYQNAGLNTANLLGQQGSALSGGVLAEASTQRNAFNDALAVGGVVAQGMGMGF